MIELDTLDRRILFELDRNSRQSLSDLARKIRQGRDRVEYRVDRLLDKQIISKYITQIDLYRLGFSFYKTYLRLENNKQRVASFLSHLRKHPRIYWLALCDGGWDLIVIVLARNAKEFYSIHSAILSQFNDVVLNFSSYTIVDYQIHTRNYLLQNPRSFDYYGGVPDHQSIDAIDAAILRMLSENARVPTAEIAETVDVTAPAVTQRIRRLEKVGLIVSYQLGLNLQALGLVMFKAQFYLRSYDLTLRERFRQFCNQQGNIIYYIEQVGDCNIEIEMEVSGYEEYARIIEEIRGDYAKLIRNFNTVLIRDSWYSPMPTDLVMLNG